jgi:muconolactone delta-isomerase
MRFLAIGTWAADERVPPLLPAERQRSAELTEEGLLLGLWLRADGTGGYLLVEAESAETALEGLETLPFMQHGLMRVELVELKG